MCTCRPACRRCPAASMATMSPIPTRISDDLGGEAAWAGFVRARAREWSCAFCSTSCRITCPPRTTIRGGMMCWRTDPSANSPITSIFRNPPHGPFRVHLCSLGAALWGGARGGRTHASRSCRDVPRVRHYDNTWPLGPASWGSCCRRPARDRTSRSLLRASSSACASSASPTRGRATRLCDACGASAEMLAEAARGGRLQEAVDRAAGRQGTVGCGAAAPILRAAWLEARGRTGQLPAIFRHRHA